MKRLTKIVILAICLGCGCSSNSADKVASSQGLLRVDSKTETCNRKISREIGLSRNKNNLVLEIKADSLFVRGSANLQPKRLTLLQDVQRLIDCYHPDKIAVGMVGKLVAGDTLMEAHYWGRIQAVIDYLWRARKDASFIHSDRLEYDIRKPAMIKIELLDFYA